MLVTVVSLAHAGFAGVQITDLQNKTEEFSNSVSVFR
jgi:hypothetical protein